MRKLLLSATVVALSVNLATNISYAQTIITEGGGKIHEYKSMEEFLHEI